MSIAIHLAKAGWPLGAAILICVLGLSSFESDNFLVPRSTNGTLPYTRWHRASVLRVDGLLDFLPHRRIVFSHGGQVPPLSHDTGIMLALRKEEAAWQNRRESAI